MFILSQNKEKLYNLSGHIEGIGYEETKEHTKGKKEDKIRHTLMVYDGCCEEVAEYETKEDCMLILYAIFKAIEQGTNLITFLHNLTDNREEFGRVFQQLFGIQEKKQNLQQPSRKQRRR